MASSPCRASSMADGTMIRRSIVLLTCFIATNGYTAVVTGLLTDHEGTPLGNVEVALYRGESTRRPPDFVSHRSDEQGRYRIVVPPGSYHAVARERLDDDVRFGPIPLDRRHSGDAVPVKIERDDQTLILNLTLSTLKEIAQNRRREQSPLVTLDVRVVDRDGRGIPGATVVAVIPGSRKRFPDHLSPSTNDDGRTTLSLPPGTYDVGATTIFPPPIPRSPVSISTDRRGPITVTLE